MRILLWHGWLLDGTGSNVYTAKVAEAFRRRGHDVLILCQERRAERFPFVDAAGTVGPDGISWDGQPGGHVSVLRPEIGTLLPVFVLDEYPGFEVKRFPDLSADELAGYLGSNVEALRTAAQWFRPDVTIAGHAVPGAVVACRALGDRSFVAKIHGSDLEYAMRVDPRYVDLAREGLEAAVAVTGGTRDVLIRTIGFVPTIRDRTRVIPPGVEVELFAPRPRREALLDAVNRLTADEDPERGRPDGIDGQVRDALASRDASALEGLAGRYDQSAPDRTAAAKLEAIAALGGPVVGYLGKLIPQKGVELLIQAVVGMPDPPHLLVVGFGSFREWLTALVDVIADGDAEALSWLEAASPMTVEIGPDRLGHARGLCDRVTFTGRLDHRYAPAALAAMDVLVVPSILDEAFGMVAAEGAACGALPLVARHSGLAEIADALEGAVGAPGLFSYEPGPGAVRRIRDRLERLLTLPSDRAAHLRTEASSFVAREWTWDRTAGHLLEAAARARS